MLDIVLMDDDPAVLASVVKRLEQRGHTVRTAANGYLGLKEVEKTVPDLVITDIIMPEREGIETILAIKKSHPTLKILAISGGGRAGRVRYLESAGTLGADGTLGKPFTTQQLIDAITALGLAA